jgi:hypothetical protein
VKYLWLIVISILAGCEARHPHNADSDPIRGMSVVCYSANHEVIYKSPCAQGTKDKNGNWVFMECDDSSTHITIDSTATCIQ